MQASYRQPVGLLVAWLGLLVGALGVVLVPPALAVDLTASSGIPSVFFNDTNIAGLEWRIESCLCTAIRSDLSIDDLQSSTEVVNLRSSANNSNSLVVDGNGDIHFADDSMFLDRSLNRLGIGTTVPAASLHVIGDIRTVGGAQSWQLSPGAGGL